MNKPLATDMFDQHRDPVAVRVTLWSPFRPISLLPFEAFFLSRSLLIESVFIAAAATSSVTQRARGELDGRLMGGRRMRTPDSDSSKVD